MYVCTSQNDETVKKNLLNPLSINVISSQFCPLRSRFDIPTVNYMLTSNRTHTHTATNLRAAARHAVLRH